MIHSTSHAVLASAAQPIARANYALALFETGDDLSAIEAARGLLRKDPEYWRVFWGPMRQLPGLSTSIIGIGEACSPPPAFISAAAGAADGARRASELS